jgi:hypothetical protein
VIVRLWIIFALLLVANPAWAQTDKGLPAPGSTITLKPTPTGYEAGIVVARASKYTDAKISTSDPTLARILDQRVEKEQLPPRPAPASVPAAPAEPPKPPEPPYVKLVTVVVKSGEIPQGTYPLTLIAAGAGEPEVRDLVLVVPAAKIDPPDTLVVINERWSSYLTANQPQIWETTQRAWLTNLSVDQKGNSDANGTPAGRIVAKGKLDNIPPGRNELIELNKHYSLQGEFPLGTVKGKLVVQADQLADPVTFGFEVRSRIWICWLFLPMALGLALGAITRKFLTNKLQLNQERENTFALIALIDRAVARNADADFRARANEIRAVAVAAAELKTAAAVKNATATPQTDFQAALDALNKRRGDIDKEIAALLAIVRGRYGLPAALNDTVTTAKNALEAGLPGLESNDVRQASGALQEIRNNLHTAAEIAGRAWVERTGGVGQTLDILTPLAGSALADFKTYWTTSHAAAGTAVQHLEEDDAVSMELMQAVFHALHVGANALHNVAANVGRLIKGVVGGWDKVLGEARLPQPDVWKNWLEGATGFATALADTSPTDPNDAVSGFKDDATAMLNELKAVLNSQVTDTERQELQKLLDAGKFDEAVALVAAANPAPRPAAGSEGRLAGQGPQPEEPRAMRDMLSALQFTALPLSTGTIGFTTSPRADVTPVDVLAATAQRTIQATSFLLSLIYAILIAGAGYFLFADKWIGVPLDFALVFFWAYATDIGADAATAAAKGAKRQ